jgi:hypothetical protein
MFYFIIKLDTLQNILSVMGLSSINWLHHTYKHNFKNFLKCSFILETYFKMPTSSVFFAAGTTGFFLAPLLEADLS